ncbi:MAG: 50S ribosomal protein L24 [Candidatus Omnitrophica bacterium]|nr:50S ribosomal protein L24 [Candidatus Omnitrophota bacterium]
MLKIRKGDTVHVMKGKDKGKKGRVITIFTENKKALVEGVNMLKKHKRRTRDDQQGGIVSIEAPISVSNLMVECKGCSRPARIGFKVLDNKAKTRYCKVCNEAI